MAPRTRTRPATVVIASIASLHDEASPIGFATGLGELGETGLEGPGREREPDHHDRVGDQHDAQAASPTAERVAGRSGR